MCRYVEVHMEQGPVLDDLGVPLAPVSAIAGQTRLFVSVAGSQVPCRARMQACLATSIRLTHAHAWVGRVVARCRRVLVHQPWFQAKDLLPVAT